MKGTTTREEENQGCVWSTNHTLQELSPLGNQIRGERWEMVLVPLEDALHEMTVFKISIISPFILHNLSL